MLGGYAGKFLWVNLSTREVRVETPDDSLLRDFVGGYGVASRLYYDRMSAGIDPMGPENILGITTGPLTGSPAPTGTRYTVTCKSPLTGGWGDANGSGWMGPAMKAAGFDCVFFTGIADEPVYLYMEDGKAEIRDASHLWGKDCYETDDWVKAEFGKDAEAVCIGPAGENLSLIAAAMHAKGRTAARSGVGAVMGSKRLKAVVVRGSQAAAVADPERARELRKKYIQQIRDGVGFASAYTGESTPGYTSVGMTNGDSPLKNWLISAAHAPDPAPLKFSELVKYRGERKACWHCPIACWGTSRINYHGEEIETHQPEYETGAAFGSMMMNNDLFSLIKANDVCNRYGLDTISAGGCVAFAFECFEHGLITKADTGGLELRWGDPKAITDMTEKLARREDFGDVIADGVMRAAQKLGPKAEPFAIHAGGQELAMHDSRYEPALAVIYKVNATPGRHTQGCQYFVPEGYESDRPGFGEGIEKQEGRGRWVKEAELLTHTMNCSGMCLFGYLSTKVDMIPEFMTAVTGEEFTLQDMLKTGERVANMRQAFNVRDGINPITRPDPERAYGHPPLPDGPTAGIDVQVDMLVREHLEEMGWTLDAAVPKKETLEALGLDDVARDLWK